MNPYTPGAGLRPAALVGRDEQMQEWAITLQRLENGRAARSVVLHGLRGAGRTVLLEKFHHIAMDRGWVTVKIKARAGTALQDTLAHALTPVVREVVRPGASDKLRQAAATLNAFIAQVTATGPWFVDLDGVSAVAHGNSGDLAADVTAVVADLAEAAQERGAGLAILIDETQALTRPELEVLCAICHQGAQRGWRVLVALAGLPNLPTLLFEAKGYAERLFSYRRLAGLPDGPARQALIQPAASQGATWEDEAADYVVTQTGGHPYFLQACGQATWEAANGRRVLTLEDARAGTLPALAHMDAGFYRPRWQRATPAQQRYLAAMAHDGAGPSESRYIAARLVQPAASIRSSRDSLIKKGLIYAPRRGRVAYALPGMAGFIAGQAKEGWHA
jgi:hypothetical protein